ncbi:MAG TPA: carbon storage regulator [Gammaproteobacteria bacterium]|nr:carbon storage regulator [Gammaproteobacteria bacterium]|tara:strand:+ start:374 stop:580 length:207 start_codon:yes stop_codon:yes gene_type:complete
MLVLSERKGKKIIINPGKENEMEITVLAHRGGQYKIGFNAPLDVQIVREDVLIRDQENEHLKNKTEVG